MPMPHFGFLKRRGHDKQSLSRTALALAELVDNKAGGEHSMNSVVTIVEVPLTVSV